MTTTASPQRHLPTPRDYVRVADALAAAIVASPERQALLDAASPWRALGDLVAEPTTLAQRRYALRRARAEVAS